MSEQKLTLNLSPFHNNNLECQRLAKLIIYDGA